ncbi:hypothetical protein [Geomonas edaphica]|uniref:hypothetical protein n=1 Tax=Geomonas edaphica TaxID=2570226 RepID=UPI0010A8997A|nr:hypothetical protein [Geomonas edaphica]
MRELLAEAVRLVVGVERKSETLYRRGAMATEDRHRSFFQRLAEEQSRRIEALLRQLPEAEATVHEPGVSLSCLAAISERGTAPGNHLHQAMLDKRFSIDLYATFCRCFKEPGLCRLFETALVGARREFRVITAEYLKGGCRSDAAATSRPQRRSHQRGELPNCAPNRHSQLFFAMQDSGRPSRIG